VDEHDRANATEALLGGGGPGNDGKVLGHPPLKSTRRALGLAAGARESGKLFVAWQPAAQQIAAHGYLNAPFELEAEAKASNAMPRHPISETQTG
jgi:hypothetical protein